MRPLLPDPRPYFADLPDPRRETRNKLHELHDILMIVLCAVLSGDGSVCRRKGRLAARVSEPAQRTTGGSRFAVLPSTCCATMARLVTVSAAASSAVRIAAKTR
jgi:hypothetical protein